MSRSRRTYEGLLKYSDNPGKPRRAYSSPRHTQDQRVTIVWMVASAAFIALLIVTAIIGGVS